MFSDVLGTVSSVENDSLLMDNSSAYFDCNEFNNLDISDPGNFTIFYMNSRSLCRHFFRYSGLSGYFKSFFHHLWFHRNMVQRSPSAVCSHG